MRHEAGQHLSFESISATAIGQTTISIPLGIVIGLLASFVQSLGLTIQRKSHVLNQRLPDHAQKAETRRPSVYPSLFVHFTANRALDYGC